jgi:hypothetical protein
MQSRNLIMTLTDRDDESDSEEEANKYAAQQKSRGQLSDDLDPNESESDDDSYGLDDEEDEESQEVSKLLK